MLVPELHNLLTRCVGEVKIANEGQTALMVMKKDHLAGRDREHLQWPGETYKVCCPFCSDTHHSLSVNHLYGQPDIRGWPRRHLAYCFNKNCLADRANRDAFFHRLFGVRNARERLLNEPLPGRQDWAGDGLSTVQKLPGTVVPLAQLPPDHPAVWHFVGERGYPMEVLTYYQVGYCTEYDPDWYPDPQSKHKMRWAQGRVILPIYQEGVLRGWQARAVLPGDTGPKYLSCPGMQKRNILYNEDSAKLWPFVVVVEGVTDAWRVGPPAVATLGKVPSAPQELRLQRMCFNSPLIFLVEAAAEDELVPYIHRLRQTRRVPTDYQVLEENLDPGSLSAEAVWSIIHGIAARGGYTLSMVPKQPSTSGCLSGHPHSRLRRMN